MQKEALEVNKEKKEGEEGEEPKKKAIIEQESTQVQILREKLELMNQDLEIHEIQKEMIEFQIENAEKFNLSQEKRLQLQIQLLGLNKKEVDGEKKKSDAIKAQREQDRKDAILHSDNLVEASERLLSAKATEVVAHAISGVFAKFPPPMNAIMAPLAGASAMRIVGEGIKKAKGNKFRQGGFVDGFGGGDKVPAMLEQGEFVMNKESVQAIGIQNLQELNAGRNGGGMNLIFNAPVTNEDFVRDFIAPTIEENLQRNLS